MRPPPPPLRSSLLYQLSAATLTASTRSGLGLNGRALRQLGAKFALHPLALEDAVHLSRLSQSKVHPFPVCPSPVSHSLTGADG